MVMVSGFLAMPRSSVNTPSWKVRSLPKNMSIRCSRASIWAVPLALSARTLRRLSSWPSSTSVVAWYRSRLSQNSLLLFTVSPGRLKNRPPLAMLVIHDDLNRPVVNNTMALIGPLVTPSAST
ncbi:hypothetical protein D3C85_845230 [compost metagenome]